MIGRTVSGRLTSLALLSAVVLVAACDDETLLPPTPSGGAMFARYVSLGNSITAGYQSGGINDSTQLQSYAVLLAAQMGHRVGATYNVPLLNAPGCPPPLTNLLTGARVGGGTSTTCLVRSTEIPPFLNNVAVPGAEVVDAINNLDPSSNPNTLTSLFLGGRTQLEAAAQVRPSFVSVWLGNNDVLGAALARNAGLATPAATFASRYDTVMTRLDGMGVTNGVLLGVPNVTRIPHFNPGQFYLGLKLAGQLPANYNVANCQPAAQGGAGDVTLVPFSYGFGVLFAQAAAGATVTLDCFNDAQVLTLTEIGTITALVSAYNTTIKNAADARGWAWVNADSALAAMKAAGQIPTVPNLTDPTGAPFGPLFSLDGIHPNAAAHKLLANLAIAAINAKYATTLQTVQ